MRLGESRVEYNHKSFQSESLEIFFKQGQSRAMTWSCRLRVESQKQSRYLKSWILKLESTSSQTKFNIFLRFLFLLQGGVAW